MNPHLTKTKRARAAKKAVRPAIVWDPIPSRSEPGSFASVRVHGLSNRTGRRATEEALAAIVGRVYPTPQGLPVVGVVIDEYRLSWTWAHRDMTAGEVASLRSLLNAAARDLGIDWA